MGKAQWTVDSGRWPAIARLQQMVSEPFFNHENAKQRDRETVKRRAIFCVSTHSIHSYSIVRKGAFWPICDKVCKKGKRESREKGKSSSSLAAGPLANV